MFLDLVSIMAGVAGCLGAVLAARNMGRLDLLIGWIVGLGVGFSCFWVLRVGIKWVLQRLNLYEPKLPTCRLILTWLLCFVAFLWVILSAFLGFWIIRLIVHS